MAELLHWRRSGFSDLRHVMQAWAALVSPADHRMLQHGSGMAVAGICHLNQTQERAEQVNVKDGWRHHDRRLLGCCFRGDCPCAIKLCVCCMDDPCCSEDCQIAACPLCLLSAISSNQRPLSAVLPHMSLLLCLWLTHAVPMLQDGCVPCAVQMLHQCLQLHRPAFKCPGMLCCHLAYPSPCLPFRTTSSVTSLSWVLCPDIGRQGAYHLVLAVCTMVTLHSLLFWGALVLMSRTEALLLLGLLPP